VAVVAVLAVLLAVAVLVALAVAVQEALVELVFLERPILAAAAVGTAMLLLATVVQA
jgi:hypothetical protein